MTISSPVQAEDFNRYIGEAESQETALLGHLVLYSIYKSPVTPAQLALWFAELGLDKTYLPGDIRLSDVYERITGPAGVKRTYRLTEPRPQQQTLAIQIQGAPAQTRRDGTQGPSVTLMPRHVTRAKNTIVRHLVREFRDEQQTSLSYTANVAEIIFRRDTSALAGHGAGSLKIIPDLPIISTLPAEEQQQIRGCLSEITDEFEAGKLYLCSNRLRTMLHSYIESFKPVRIRSGVYFVGREHAPTLAKLRELVSRFNSQSSLTRVPLPDQEEQREMIIAAFISQTDDELHRLSADIRKAITGRATKTVVEDLHRRFRDLKASAGQHEQILGGSIADAQASMEVVKQQLNKLLDL